MTHVIDMRPIGAMTTYIPLPTDPTQRALLGFLSKYHGATLESYRHSLKVWGNWCEPKGIQPLYIDRLGLTVYVRWLQDLQLAPATVAVRYGAVRSFLRYAYRDELIPKNPGDFVDPPKVDKDAQYRTWLSPLEMASVFRAAKIRSPRDHLLTVVMGMLGLRVSEACSLNVESVEPVEGVEVINFIGKGNKAATIVLPLPILRPLHKMVEIKGSGALFTTRTGKRMTAHDVGRAVNTLAELAQLDHHITPHAFRRGFANAGRIAHVDRGQLQEAMRHANDDTLNTYLKRNDILTASTYGTIASFLAALG